MASRKDTKRTNASLPAGKPTESRRNYPPIGTGRKLQQPIKPQVTTGAENREHKRHLQALPVRIFRRSAKGDFDFHASLEMRDVSVGGVYLKSTFHLRIGAQVDLAFELPNSEHEVEVRGKVVNVIDADEAQPGHKSAGFALEFTHFYGESEIYLRAFLTRGDMHEFVRKSGGAMFPKADPALRLKLVEFLVRWQIYQESLERAEAAAGGRHR